MGLLGPTRGRTQRHTRYEFDGAGIGEVLAYWVHVLATSFKALRTAALPEFQDWMHALSDTAPTARVPACSLRACEYVMSCAPRIVMSCAARGGTLHALRPAFKMPGQRRVGVVSYTHMRPSQAKYPAKQSTNWQGKGGRVLPSTRCHACSHAGAQPPAT